MTTKQTTKGKSPAQSMPAQSQKRLDDLKRCRDVSRLPGNADYNKYMRGIANGLELAVAIMEDREPVYLTAPNEPSEAKQAALTNNQEG